MCLVGGVWAWQQLDQKHPGPPEENPASSSAWCWGMCGIFIRALRVATQQSAVLSIKEALHIQLMPEQQHFNRDIGCRTAGLPPWWRNKPHTPPWWDRVFPPIHRACLFVCLFFYIPSRKKRLVHVNTLKNVAGYLKQCSWGRCCHRSQSQNKMATCVFSVMAANFGKSFYQSSWYNKRTTNLTSRSITETRELHYNVIIFYLVCN